MTSAKANYLRLLLTMPADWIAASAADPGPYMTRTHVRLHFIALRRLGLIARATS